MDMIQVITLSIVEGVTEFLPISSTGHMVVVSHLMNIPQSSIHINLEITVYREDKSTTKSLEDITYR